MAIGFRILGAGANHSATLSVNYSARMVLPGKRLQTRGGALNSERAARMRRDERVGWRLVGLGVQVTSEVVAGAGIGWLVDYFMKSTEHWGVLIGGCVGIAVGLTTLIRTAWKINKELDGPKPPKGTA